MSTITTAYGEAFKIETVAAGYGRIENVGFMPEVVILRDDQGTWFAMFVGSTRYLNFLADWPITGGQKTREAAALWLLDGGC